jgi:hypothetical protein
MLDPSMTNIPVNPASNTTDDTDALARNSAITHAGIDAQIREETGDQIREENDVHAILTEGNGAAFDVDSGAAAAGAISVDPDTNVFSPVVSGVGALSGLVAGSTINTGPVLTPRSSPRQ